MEPNRTEYDTNTENENGKYEMCETISDNKYLCGKDTFFLPISIHESDISIYTTRCTTFSHKSRYFEYVNVKKCDDTFSQRYSSVVLLPI